MKRLVIQVTESGGTDARNMLWFLVKDEDAERFTELIRIHLRPHNIFVDDRSGPKSMADKPWSAHAHSSPEDLERKLKERKL